MTVDDIAQLVEAAATAHGDRYDLLVEAHDALRAALAGTDDASAARR
jgi:hypothetical protein